MFTKPDNLRVDFNRWGKLKQRSYNSIMLGDDKSDYKPIPLSAMIMEYKKELLLSKISEDCIKYKQLLHANYTIKIKQYVKDHKKKEPVVVDQPVVLKLDYCDHDFAVDPLSVKTNPPHNPRQCSRCKKNEIEIADAVVAANGVMFHGDKIESLPEYKLLLDAIKLYDGESTKRHQQSTSSSWDRTFGDYTKQLIEKHPIEVTYIMGIFKHMGIVHVGAQEEYTIL